MNNDSAYQASMQASNAANTATIKAFQTGQESDHLSAGKAHEDAAAKAENAARQLRASGDLERAREREGAMAYNYRCIGMHKQESLSAVEGGRTAAGSAPQDAILAGAAELRRLQPDRFKTDAEAVEAFCRTARGNAAYEHYHDGMLTGDRRLPITR
jgi:hypothetical protein